MLEAHIHRLSKAKLRRECLTLTISDPQPISISPAAFDQILAVHQPCFRFTFLSLSLSLNSIFNFLYSFLSNFEFLILLRALAPPLWINGGLTQVYLLSSLKRRIWPSNLFLRHTRVLELTFLLFFNVFELF